MKSLICFLLVSICLTFNTPAFSECKTTTGDAQTLAQSDLSPLDILILDLEEVQRLIEEGDNQTAITILKSSLGQVRKVDEFDKATKKTTAKRIKKGIKLLKQNKSEEALDLLQTAFDALEEEGLI